MRKLAIGVMVFILIFVALVPLGHSSLQNLQIGYKWSFKKMEIGNGKFVGNNIGCRVMGLYVKYNGDENGTYNISYFGSYYAYGIGKGVYSIGGKHSDRGRYRSTIKMLWINWDGYILLRKMQVPYHGKLYDVYGVAKQYIHLYTKRPLDEYSNISYAFEFRNNFWEHVNATRFAVGTYNLTAIIIYKRPLPYILEEDGNLSYTIAAYYSGHISGNFKGYDREKWKGDLGNFTLNWNLSNNVSRDFQGEIHMVSHIYRNGNEAERAGLLENIPTAFPGIPFIPYGKLNSSQDLGFAMQSFFLELLMRNKATFSNGFYREINLNNTFASSKSMAAKEIEIREMMQKAPELYGSYEAHIIAMNASLLVAISLGILILAVSAIEVRKK